MNDAIFWYDFFVSNLCKNEKIICVPYWLIVYSLRTIVSDPFYFYIAGEKVRESWEVSFTENRQPIWRHPGKESNYVDKKTEE